MFDYAIIAVYAVLLFGLATLFELNQLAFTPISGQLIGFISLTLPVFLYSFLTENSQYRATIGKRIMNIIVRTDADDRGKRILIRNILKFLPWEIAHTGVHWIIYYAERGTPTWVWFTLIVPQIVVVGYVISIIASGGNSSFYDKQSQTVVSLNSL